MQYRRLGRTELMVAEVGVGARALASGGDAEGAADVLRAAIEAGVNLVEVDVHRPEELAALGAAIGRLRPQLLIVGLGGDDRATVEAALARLGLDHFDCYLAAEPDADLALVEAFTLEGLARYCGVASNDPATALAAVLAGNADVVQVPLHPLELVSPSGVDAVLNAARSADVGVLACSPLAGGRLGAHGEPALLEALAFLADGAPRSLAQGAIAWALSEPRLAAVVTGPRTVEQAIENAEASRAAPLPSEVLERTAVALGAAGGTAGG